MVIKLYVQNAVMYMIDRAPNSNVQDAEEVEVVPFLPLVPLNFNLNFVFILPDNGYKPIKIALF